MRDPFLSHRRIESLTSRVHSRLLHASPEVKLRVLAEVDRFRNACGCGTGAAAAILALLITGTWQFIGYQSWSLTWALTAGGKILAATLMAALVGKLSGLAYARFRFRRKTQRLLENIHV